MLNIDLINKYVEFNSEFIIAAFMIIICPITWNLVARLEFHTKFFSKFVGDNRLAADIFAHILIEMGIFRNFMFNRVTSNQNHYNIGNDLFVILGSYFLLVIGLLFTCGSFYRLGIHGIYYADYFGILMKDKVTAFPYNITDNPLYIGSTLIFLSGSLYDRSVSGLILSILAWLMYNLASILENPMTELIYSEENIKSVKKMNEEREKNISYNKKLKSIK